MSYKIVSVREGEREKRERNVTNHWVRGVVLKTCESLIIYYGYHQSSGKIVALFVKYLKRDFQIWFADKEWTTSVSSHPFRAPIQRFLIQKNFK